MKVTFNGLTTVSLFLMGFLLLSIPAHAQDDSEDLHAYFDDGGLSMRKNLIATDFLSPLYGAVALRYERAIGKSFSMEVGVYKLTSFYLYEMLLPIGSVINGFDPDGGVGIFLSPHIFFDDRAPERHYMGPRYGWRRYTLADGATTVVHDLTLDYGYNIHLGEYLMFCYNVGGGYRRIVRSESPGLPGYGHGYAETIGMPCFFWSLGLGVMF